MFIIALTGLTLVGIVVFVYGFYFLAVLRRPLVNVSDRSVNGYHDSDPSSLPPVSIIVSTFNEARVIERKINNLANLTYQKNSLEVIVYDDASKDRTCEIATDTLHKNSLSGKVISNPSRIGLNRSLNLAIAQASHDLVCVTDSDVLLEKDALVNAVRVLQEQKNVGGVTGHIQPVFESKGITQQSEISYRGFYHASMLAESSLHSAFPGNGPLIVFDKSKVPFQIPNDYGSTDGNIAMNVIRHGFRFLYVPDSIVFEPSAENLKQHKMQKVRRAKRLLQVFIRNRDIAFNADYGKFGRLIFPLKLIMFVMCPLLLLMGLLVLGTAIVLSQNLILYVSTGLLLVATLLLSLISKRLGSLLSSFLLHQGYLVIGLFSSFRKSGNWKTIDRKTALNMISAKELSLKQPL